MSILHHKQTFAKNKKNTLKTGKHDFDDISKLIVKFVYSSIPCVSVSGQYVFDLMDTYGGGLGVLWVAIFESTVIMWVYGVGRFADDLGFMLNHKVCKNIFLFDSLNETTYLLSTCDTLIFCSHFTDFMVLEDLLEYHSSYSISHICYCNGILDRTNVFGISRKNLLPTMGSPYWMVPYTSDCTSNSSHRNIYGCLLRM